MNEGEPVSTDGGAGVNASTQADFTPPPSTVSPPAPPALLTYLEGLVSTLRGHVPKALGEFDETAVHQARVATRRLSAALDLLEPLLHRHDYKDLARTLRKLRRRLGPHRDLDVLIGYVDELAADGRFTLGAAFVSRHLRARRSLLRREASEKDRTPRTLEKLSFFSVMFRSLAEHPAGMLPLVAEGIHTFNDEFTALADLLGEYYSSRRAASSGGAGWGVPSEMLSLDPHELRIAGKHLRYSLELAEAEGVKGLGGGAGVLKSFKQMQDDLGEWHDYVVLGDTILALVAEEGLTHRDAELGSAVLLLAAECLTRAKQKLEHFSVLWTERGPQMTKAIREALPLSRQAPAHPSEWPGEETVAR